MKKLLEALRDLLARGEAGVLVTVTASSGSVPRGAGAHMLVAAGGRVWGSIGGGPVERRAEEEALAVLQSGTCAARRFCLGEGGARDVGMVCGGDVSVWFHVLSGPRALERAEGALAALESGERCWLGLELPGGALAVHGERRGTLGGSVPREVLEALGGRPLQIEAAGGLWYAEPLSGAGRVFVFGGGHVAQALLPALAAVGFRCVVVEDRPEFCDSRLFPGAAQVRLVEMDRLDQALEVGAEDYVCIMTRGHANDAACEAFALTTPARYIGVMGSRRKTAWVNGILREKGFTDADLARVTTPIGLDIGAETPAEIAVSVAAQLIQVRAQGRGTH